MLNSYQAITIRALQKAISEFPDHPLLSEIGDLLAQALQAAERNEASSTNRLAFAAADKALGFWPAIQAASDAAREWRYSYDDAHGG